MDKSLYTRRIKDIRLSSLTTIPITNKSGIILKMFGVCYGAPAALCALSAGSAQVSDGQINFDWPVSFEGPYSEVVVADFHNDGLMDFATIESWDNVRTFRNLGNEVFIEESFTLVSEDSLQQICVGDFNNDGYTDITCLARWLASTPYILINDGTGQFPDVITLDYLGINSNRLYPVDLDNDRDSDLISYFGNTISILKNNGDANFEIKQTYNYYDPEYYPQEIAIGDIDNDGDMDMGILFVYEYTYREIKGRQIVILSNDGKGSFTETFDISFDSDYNRMAPESLCMGDLDGDSDIDISVLSGDPYRDYNSEIQILENINNGAGFNVISKIVYPINGSAEFIRNTDLDTDGDLDFIITNSGARGFYTLENYGGLEFGSLSAFATKNGNNLFDFGDFNNDGQTDVISEGNGLAYVTNITPVPGRDLVLEPLIRGQSSYVEIAGLKPGEKVWFLYSNHGWGNSFGRQQLGGLVMDLAEPMHSLGAAVADVNGIAKRIINVPEDAPLIDVVIQAVVRRGANGQDSIKSKYITAPILE